MSASVASLIRDLAIQGVHLSPRGESLHVEAPVGIVTDELRRLLTYHKRDLLASLAVDTIRGRLMELLEAELIDGHLIARLPDADLGDLAGLPDSALEAFARSLRDSDLREHGKRPKHETAPALCRHCGPIWLHPAVAAVVSLLDGWPRVLGCPWCHVRNRIAIPRPPVTCGDCEHFARDTVNPKEGAGACKAGQNPKRPWPMASRQCGHFQPENAP